MSRVIDDEDESLEGRRVGVESLLEALCTLVLLDFDREEVDEGEGIERVR